RPPAGIHGGSRCSDYSSHDLSQFLKNLVILRSSHSPSTRNYDARLREIYFLRSLSYELLDNHLLIWSLELYLLDRRFLYRYDFFRCENIWSESCDSGRDVDFDSEQDFASISRPGRN